MSVPRPGVAFVARFRFQPTSVPKAQGAEDPAVVIPLVTQYYSMLRRNLAYTAVTRGKELVVIIGQAKALALAVRGARARRRWARLAEWFGGEGSVASGLRESVTA